MSINLNNMFEFCDDDIICDDVLYHVGETFGNSNNVFALKNNNKRILTYSNDWLYLIKHYYTINAFPHKYISMIDYYNNIKNLKPIEINENVIPFISAFSCGTMHGYAAIYDFLIEYIENYEQYKDYKILVFRQSQQGILDIINHFIDINILNKNKIMYVDKNILYNFKSVYFIKLRGHSVLDFKDKINKLVHKYIVNNITNPIIKNTYFDWAKYVHTYPDLQRAGIDSYEKALNHWNNYGKNEGRDDCFIYTNTKLEIHDKIAIIKNNGSQNLTDTAIFNRNIVMNFCNKNNYHLLEPGTISEINLIYLLNNAKTIALSWGTTFFKNLMYISDKCENIYVIIKKGSPFVDHYHKNSKHGILLESFKNAKIEYIITDNLNI